MFSQSFNTEVNPGDASANTKFRREPELTKKQMLKRNSFPSVNDNRFLNRLLQGGGK